MVVYLFLNPCFIICLKNLYKQQFCMDYIYTLKLGIRLFEFELQYFVFSCKFVYPKCCIETLILVTS